MDKQLPNYERKYIFLIVFPVYKFLLLLPVAIEMEFYAESFYAEWNDSGFHRRFFDWVALFLKEKTRVLKTLCSWITISEILPDRWVLFMRRLTEPQMSNKLYQNNWSATKNIEWLLEKILHDSDTEMCVFKNCIKKLIPL